MKKNIGEVLSSDVLAKLDNLSVTTWNYKKDTGKKRHMGPMAQDFHAAFGLGDEKTIFPLDANGVAFAAIQELNRKIEAQNVRIQQLEQANTELHVALEQLIGKTETNKR